MRKSIVVRTLYTHTPASHTKIPIYSGFRLAKWIRSLFGAGDGKQIGWANMDVVGNTDFYATIWQLPATEGPGWVQ